MGNSVFAMPALCEAIFDLAERAERERMINRELLHRNRNLFAIVTTLAAQTLKRAGVDVEITASLRARITALARAQELISLDDRQSMPLEHLVDRVLVPIMPEAVRLVVEGSPAGITGDQVTGLALVLHELGTNALKYGAWSEDSGQVAVSWCRSPLDLAITWQERGGPPTFAPGARGLGSLLIETAIPGARVERSFEPAGLKVVLRVPLRSGGLIQRRQHDGLVMQTEGVRPKAEDRGPGDCGAR
jgi:two-component sensor histidine kinase